VIGVAKDVKQQGVDQPTRSEFHFLVEQTGLLRAYWLFGTGAPGTMHVALRTTLPAAALSQTIHRTVREVDPAIPIVRLRSMEEAFAESIRRPRLLAQLLSVFAGLALLLAVIGIYGVLSCMVAARRREMGIRMALGARRFTVLAEVMKQGLMLTGFGIIVGLIGAFGLNRLITSLLFGVTTTDTMTFLVVIATILLAGALACGLPAWRASRLDPNVVLRAE
jgi:ABC-type antimicrobial peptide transport system permease subunit